ncbi:hypothetical protein Catovirus_1_901 [Catovirus CTV1]|uniref:Uncharacterized protein n=1 Tax=Catovirus CTV1 TaxID=1977631 RepID=A0A1V0SAZ0_9VIRU|nr:hypothetical protein Catovirus_1_901 [Catovirus CTV1]
MSKTSTKTSLTKTIKTPDISGITLTVPNISAINTQITNSVNVSFVIYMIFAIATFMLIGYLLTLNSVGDFNIQNKIIIWGLFIASILVFLTHRILYFFDFEYKQITMAIIMIIGAALSASSLITARNYGYIGNNYTDLYYVAQGMNVLTTALGLVPLYYSS